MKKRKKIFNILIIFVGTLGIILTCFFFYPISVIGACVDEPFNKKFMEFIDSVSEENTRLEARKRGLEVGGTWKDMDSPTNIFAYSMAVTVAKNPEPYFCDALRIIEDKKYDQSQKLYTVLLMQRLPIGKYIYFMDKGNEAYEKGNIDKEILGWIISPAQDVKTTTSSYWFLPKWRKQFLRHAHDVYSDESIEEYLRGDFANFFD